MNTRVRLFTKRLLAATASTALLAVFALAQATDDGGSNEHFERGRALTQKGDLPGAATAYRKAIETAGGTYAEAHNNLGMVLGMMGDNLAAIDSFRTAIRQKTDYTEAHYNLGISLSLADDLVGAEREFLNAIKLGEGHFPEAHSNLGILYARKGETKRAITEFQIAIEQAEGHYPEAHYNLGIALYSLGKLEPAISEFKDAVEQNESFPEAHYNLAVALAKLGRNEDAARSFESYLRLAANPVDGDEVRSRITELRQAVMK